MHVLQTRMPRLLVPALSAVFETKGTAKVTGVLTTYFPTAGGRGQTSQASCRLQVKQREMEYTYKV